MKNKTLFILVSIAALSSCSPIDETKIHDISCNSDLASNSTIYDANEAENICASKANIEITKSHQHYEVWANTFKIRAHEQQSTYTKYSFFVSIFFVFFGSLVTLIEFIRNKDTESKFSFSKDGIEISSKYLGIAVLCISLVFSYIFLDKAYPLRTVEDERNK